jgi:DNA-binding MarR family transcriptional regulator
VTTATDTGATQSPDTGAAVELDQQGRTDGPTTELVRAANILRVHLDQMVLREFGLHWTAFDILQLICHSRYVETGNVAAALAISKGAVTDTTARLLARGLVRRHPRPADRRRIVLVPTAAGSELTQRIRRRVAAEEIRILRRVTSLIDARAMAVLRHIAQVWPPADPAEST